MSNRKAHRRESFRRSEKSVQPRLRRPGRSAVAVRQFEERRERRGVWKIIHQWLAEVLA